MENKPARYDQLVKYGNINGAVRLGIEIASEKKSDYEKTIWLREIERVVNLCGPAGMEFTDAFMKALTPNGNFEPLIEWVNNINRFETLTQEAMNSFEIKCAKLRILGCRGKSEQF